MLDRWKYEPLLQPTDPAITKMRSRLCLDIIKTNPNVSQKKATNEEREQKCFYFAIKATTGFNKPLDFWPGVNFFSSININNYFDQTNHPQPNDLAIYTESKTNLAITHFAVVTEVTKKNIVLHSKWGSIEPILQHGPFDVPHWYGNAVGFFTLKDIYKSFRGKQLLHTAMISEKKRNDVKLFVVSYGPLILMTIGALCYNW